MATNTAITIFEKSRHDDALPPDGYSYEDIPDGVVEVNDLTQGMVNKAPKQAVPAGSGRIVRNARVRDYWTGRRPGTAEFGGVKPDSATVLAIVTFITESLDAWVCRITKTSFYAQDAAGTWNEFSIEDSDGNLTSFPDQDLHLSFAQFFEKLYMADGVSPIWEIDFNSNRVRQIEGAPRPKYITNYAERIIAANLSEPVGGVRPSKVRWSANFDPTNWDDISSGFEDLAANDVGDVITGIWGLEREMVLVRRRSIMHATRLPFAQSPFRFNTVIDDIGCDLPYTIARVPGGLIWADQRTREVYIYQPGSRPQALGVNVNRDLYEDLESLILCQGAYDPYEKEYHLGVVRSDGNGWINRVWVFNLEKRAWSYDDGPEVSTLGIVSLPGASVAIDDLVGTIDAQSVTIDEYGTLGQFTPALLKGTATGEVISQSYSSANDWDSSVFEFEFQSPNIGSTSRRRTMKDLELTIEAPVTGSYTLEQSKDEVNWKNTKTTNVTGAATRQRIRLPKTMITGDDLYWRLKSTAAGIRVSEWWTRLMEKGTQQGGAQ